VYLLPAHRVKIDFYDKEGIKHTMAIEGRVTRDKVGKILDYIELMGGVESSPSSTNFIQKSTNNRFDRLLSLVLTHFPDRTFISKDVQKSYKSIYDEEVPLSTISTYLSRLVDRGVLTRDGSSFEWKYTVKSVGSPKTNSLTN
jgi:predicted transcriptional regulator